MIKVDSSAHNHTLVFLVCYYADVSFTSLPTLSLKHMYSKIES